MAFRDWVELTEPSVVRALAHPTRMAVLARLADGPATATECAEQVGESPSSCSYHLRQLAHLGFVDEVESDDGRTRRWKLIVAGFGIPKDAQSSPEMQAATSLWGRQWVAIERTILDDFMANESAEDPDWRAAATFASPDVEITADELRDLEKRFSEMIAPYIEREVYPPGARTVHVVLTAFPRVMKPGQSPNERSAT
jgi:DNA-binding transcriptional ArsR family regulator